MMKFLRAFLVTLVFLLPAIAEAQPYPINNEQRIILRDMQTQGTVGRNFSLDRFGAAMPFSISPFGSLSRNGTVGTGSTTTTIVSTSHPVKVGDTVWFTSSTRGGLAKVEAVTDANTFVIAPPLRLAPTSSDFYYDVDPAPASVDANGQLVSILRSTTGSNAIFAQNGSWTTGDGLFPGGYYREALPSTTGVPATDGKYGNAKVDTLGAQWFHSATNIDTGALITAAGLTTTQTGTDQTNYGGKGLIAVLDMTTVGTGSVTLEIDGKDTASGKYYAILTGAAVVTNSTNVYTIYPGNTVAANVSASTVLPKTWRVKVTANNANATTYTVGASVIE